MRTAVIFIISMAFVVYMIETMESTDSKTSSKQKHGIEHTDKRKPIRPLASPEFRQSGPAKKKRRKKFSTQAERLFSFNFMTGEPRGGKNQKLIEEWYKRFSTQEIFQRIVREGYKRMKQGDDLQMIESECNKAGVPVGNAVLIAIIESSWLPFKENYAHAAGWWQFIPRTAREYGLIVTKRIDERFDKEKSTEAALRYLKDLYDLTYKWSGDPSIDYHDRWHFAMAAYNRGPDKTSKTFQISNGDFSKYLEVVPDKKVYSETRNYVARVYGARRWLLEYLSGKASSPHESVADILYERYLEEKENMPRPVRLSKLLEIRAIYQSELQDEKYLEEALKIIDREIEFLSDGESKGSAST